MKLEHFVAAQIALVALWAAVNIGREVLRLQRARTELAQWRELSLWRGREGKPTSEPDSEPDPEPAYVQIAPTVTQPSSGSGHRPKGRGKKDKRRSR